MSVVSKLCRCADLLRVARHSPEGFARVLPEEHALEIENVLAAAVDALAELRRVNMQLAHENSLSATARSVVMSARDFVHAADEKVSFARHDLDDAVLRFEAALRERAQMNP